MKFYIAEIQKQINEHASKIGKICCLIRVIAKLLQMKRVNTHRPILPNLTGERDCFVQHLFHELQILLPLQIER